MEVVANSAVAFSEMFPKQFCIFASLLFITHQFVPRRSAMEQFCASRRERQLDPALSLFGQLITGFWRFNELTKQHSVIPLLSLIGVWLLWSGGSVAAAVG